MSSSILARQVLEKGVRAPVCRSLVAKRFELGDKGILAAFVRVARSMHKISWRTLFFSPKKLQNKETIIAIQSRDNHA